MSVSVQIFHQFEQFSDWPDDAILALSEKLDLKRLTRRQMVLVGSEAGTTLAWVVEGAIWLVDHSLDDRECVVGRYGPGELIGELHAFGGGRNLPAGLGYMAAGPASIAAISSSAMTGLILSNPLIAQGIIRLLAERSCSLFRWRSILALPLAVDRVIAVLEALGNERKGSQAHTLPAGITQQEIAAHANTTRETVTRTMQRLQAAGAVIREGSNWQIDPERLRAYRQTLSQA